MIRTLAFGLLALCAFGARAQSTTDIVPPSLKDWRAWVLKDMEYRSCPVLGNQAQGSAESFVCAWPSRLTVNATAEGATFSIHWQVDAPSWIPLPGNEEHWPQQVTVNNQRQPVVLYQATPALRLAAGSYEIAGRIPWRQRPQTLAVPRQIGLVSLSIDGKTVAPIQRDQESVTLGRADTGARESDSMEIRVFRKLTDGIPAQLETQIQIGSSGQAREEVIGPVLPEGFTPLSLHGDWPARLDDEGRLHLQVQAGGDTIRIDARADAALDQVKARLPAPPWPVQETWSYESSSSLRVTTATSALQVDPRQAGVPNEWSALPAFALGNDAVLTIEQRSRGLGADEGNRLTLQREAWLDFNGDGWYARDRISGKMRRGWRFDIAAPYVLERADAENAPATASNGVEPLLVTKGAKPELSGVEWRTPAVDLAAGVRVASATMTLPVSGWQDTFDQINTTLHLPFGYRLIAAPGADAASGSWMSNWTLLDAFVCAILVLLAWRYLGLVGAVASAVYLLLGYQETNAPFWTLLGVAALALVVRALPPGKLRAWAEGSRRVVLLFLILIALPFVAEQLRFALYPQLEQGSLFNAESQGFGVNLDGRMAPVSRHGVARLEANGALETPAPVPAAPPPPPPGEKKDSLETIVVTGSNILRADIIDHYSESTVVQTGTGEPSWNLGSTANLSWSGPVLASQSVHLLIAPPWAVRPLRVLLVLLLGWLIWQLARNVVQSMRRGAPLGVAALLLGGLVIAPPLQAQPYPSDQLLQQLRQRLTEAPKCTPACTSIAEAQVAANGDAVVITLDAQAIEPMAVPLPIVDASTMLKSIKVDGAADEAIYRHEDGVLWVAVGRGVHRVEAEYAVFADKVSFRFPSPPHRAQFSGVGWESSGLNDERLLADSLNLTRARSGAPGKMLAGAQQFPPYVRVERNLTLGLQWSINTQVVRIAPEHGGFTVAVPTLQGEHVTTSEVKTEAGKVLVAMEDGGSITNWQTTLDKSDTFSLTAPPLSDRAEVWRVVVSPTWHVEFSGVPESASTSAGGDKDYRNFEFDPLPGETLTVKVTRPAAVQGETRAVDSVLVATEQGQHASTHTLHFATRASQGGEQSIDLPKDAEVLGVSRDGQTINLRPRDGKLSLPLLPGRHTFDVSFRQSVDLGTIARTPELSLGLPAANIDVSLVLPADRWLLATWGPRVGPAVLYWGELLVMILVAYALSRTRRTKLAFRDWLLLGIGFSTFSWGALIVVVAWLFAFDWRRRVTLASNRTFNLAQFALAALTAIALMCLVSAIPQGLLGQPDMHVTGYGSNAHALRWFVDRSADALPRASAFSVPLWVYKVLMLMWALWLANALIGWLREAFAAWTTNGYWRARAKTQATPPTVEP